MSDFATVIAKREAAAARKAKRSEKGLALGLRTPVRVVGTRKRRKPSARKAAFLALKASAKMYVLLRTKHRTGGMCEVAVLCGGENFATLAYHVIPAATGNAIKYDPRNLLGACAQDNGGEYFDRKRGSYERWDKRHAELLGDVLPELKAATGRRQIPTHEAISMAAEYNRKISAGEWR